MSKPFDEIDPRAEAFGERLRREREMRGISLDEIAAGTKISTRLLRALEAGQLDLLPGGIFNKNYVRAYAGHIGIDEEQAVADYLEAAEEVPPDVRLIAHQNSALHNRNGVEGVPGRGVPLLTSFIVLVVIAGGMGGWYLYRQRQRERAEPVQPAAAAQTSSLNPNATASPNEPAKNAGTTSNEPVQNASAAPATTPATSTTVHTVEAAENSSAASKPASEKASTNGNTEAQTSTPFAVTIRAKETAHIEVKSDGEVVVRGVIEPDEVKTFHATNRLVLWTADAGHVEVSFNGKSVPLTSSQTGEQVLVFNSRGLIQRPPTPTQ